MMRYIIYCFTLILMGVSGIVTGQDDVVKLTNSSFEDDPQRGRNNVRLSIKHWFDCGLVNFRYETPPDIHPSKDSMWGNFKKPAHGETYLGMVVRQNDSWESVSQEVSRPFKAGQCYEFSAILARNDVYLSAAQPLKGQVRDTTKVPFTRPIVLRIWAGDNYCDTRELLAESPAIDHNNWKEYYFQVKPSRSFRFITIEAFYKVPVFEPYNGHILVDGLSHFSPIDCPESTDIYAVNTKNLEPDIPVLADATPTPKTKDKPRKNNGNPARQVKKQGKSPAKKYEKTTPKHEPKLLTDLDANTIKKGQVIELKNLFFMADSSVINNKSYEVLDEVYSFLRSNPNIKVEIGGHTNGIPPEAYCNRLSSDRAESVARYLNAKGIKSNRLVTKGYGKSHPIASNRTIVGRKRNQRVEIKILET